MTGNDNGVIHDTYEDLCIPKYTREIIRLIYHANATFTHIKVVNLYEWSAYTLEIDAFLILLK